MYSHYDNATFAARLRSHSVLSDDGSGCVLWSGAKNHDGYGILRIGSTTDGTRRVVRAHRFVYFLTHGSIPDGFEISHTCAHRHCIEPAHLVAMKHAEIIERGNTGLLNKSRTTCPQGHPYAGSNLHHTPRGRRICRACDRERKRQKRLTERAQRVAQRVAQSDQR